jgi:hypothetical protein
MKVRARQTLSARIQRNLRDIDSRRNSAKRACSPQPFTLTASHVQYFTALPRLEVPRQALKMPGQARRLTGVTVIHVVVEASDFLIARGHRRIAFDVR